MGEDASTNHIEGLAIASRVGIEESAAPIIAWSTSALCVEHVGLHADVVLRKSTTGTRVERVLVCGLLMDAFKDINFPAIGPAWTYRPICGPDTASVGHLPEVGNEQTSIVLLFGAYPDAGNRRMDSIGKISNRIGVLCGTSRGARGLTSRASHQLGHW